jgi:NAD(P)-dependent dehydrogenase (short-subunit alcohol dehydrogenase family)
MTRDSRRVVLITGCSSGFGLLSAVRLARAGHRVFASMRDLERARRLQEAARAAGVEVELLQLDVTDDASRRRAVAAVQQAAGRLDVLVNNAGHALGGFFEDLEMDELRAQFETNFFGIAALSQAVLPLMRAQGGGRIVNVSSLSGLIAQPAMSAYCASKFALEGLSEAMRHELRPHNIYVVLVEPGSFRTDIFSHNRWVARRTGSDSSPNRALSARIERRIDQVMSRFADPAIVAEVIARAATARRPRLRYAVGHDARVVSNIKRWMPFPVVESTTQWVLRRI